MLVSAEAVQGEIGPADKRRVRIDDGSWCRFIRGADKSRHAVRALTPEFSCKRVK